MTGSVRSFTAALLQGGGLLFAPALANAQSEVDLETPLARPTSDAENERKAKELMRSGVAEFRKSNYEAAREAFENVWRLKPQPVVAASLAEVEMKLGRYRDASEHWEYYLRELPPDRVEAEAQLAECRRRLGSIRVSVDTPGAIVYLDGTALGPAPMDVDVWVDPGDHALYAQLNNRTSPEKQLSIAAGEMHTITLTLPKPDPLPTVLRALSTSPPAPKPVERDDAGLEPSTVILIAGSALTAVAVGVGVGFTFKAAAVKNDADAARAEAVVGADPDLIANDRYCAEDIPNRSPACDELGEKIDDWNAARQVAMASFITAGVFGVGTAVTYFAWPKGSAHNTARGTFLVAPFVEKSARGVQIQLRF